MNDSIMVPISATPEAATGLGNTDRRARIGRLISSIPRPETLTADPMAALIAEINRVAGADELTESEIDAELAAYNAENRL